jgi:ubiquinone biosynthesis protein UbiJ
VFVFFSSAVTCALNSSLRKRPDAAARLREHSGGVVAVKVAGMRLAWRIGGDGFLQEASPLIDADALAAFSLSSSRRRAHKPADAPPDISLREGLKKRLQLSGSADMLDAFSMAANAAADDCAAKWRRMFGASPAPLLRRAAQFAKQKAEFAEEEIGAYLRDESGLLADSESVYRQGRETALLRRRIDEAALRADALLAARQGEGG